jgi:hypothetical protein
MGRSRHGLASDRQGKLVERDRQAPGHRLLDRELVVAWSQSLPEAMPGDHDLGVAVLLASPRLDATLPDTAVVGEDQQGRVCRHDLLGGLLHEYRSAA